MHLVLMIHRILVHHVEALAHWVHSNVDVQIVWIRTLVKVSYLNILNDRIMLIVTSLRVHITHLLSIIERMERLRVQIRPHVVVIPVIDLVFVLLKLWFFIALLSTSFVVIIALVNRLVSNHGNIIHSSIF